MMWLAIVATAGNALLALAGFGQRLLAERAHRQALNVYDQAEDLVRLAVQYRQRGDDAYRDADELIRDARSRIQEWTA